MRTLESARERRIRANGIDHHVVEWGPTDARGTVLLCHGFLDLAWGFVALAPRLAAVGLRIVAFDFRGHGESAWIGSGGYYHFADYLLDLHELVPALCDGPLHLVGHSMGGSVSIQYAATHEERVRTLSILEGLGPPAEDPTNAVERAKAWLEGVEAVRRASELARLRDVEHAKARLLRRHPELDLELGSFLAEKSTMPHPSGVGLAWRFDPLHRTMGPFGFDLSRFMRFTAKVRAPTLIVQGSKGLRTGDDDTRIASLPNARRHLLEGAGHMVHWTHPEATARLLLEHFSAL